MRHRRVLPLVHVLGFRVHPASHVRHRPRTSWLHRRHLRGAERGIAPPGGLLLAQVLDRRGHDDPNHDDGHEDDEQFRASGEASDEGDHVPSVPVKGSLRWVRAWRVPWVWGSSRGSHPGRRGMSGSRAAARPCRPLRWGRVFGPAHACPRPDAVRRWGASMALATRKAPGHAGTPVCDSTFPVMSCQATRPCHAHSC